MDYVGVYTNGLGMPEVFVYVGDKSYFPPVHQCELLLPVDLQGRRLHEVHDDLMRAQVPFGSLVCYPNCVIPPTEWRAINMGTSTQSIDEVVRAARRFFEQRRAA